MELQPTTPVAVTPSSASSYRGLIGVVILGLLIGCVGAWWFLSHRPATEPVHTGGTAILSLRGPTSPVPVGFQFTVDVLLDAKAYEMTAADIVISYDTRRFRAVSIVPGSLMSIRASGGVVENGTAHIIVSSGTSPAKGDGVVAVLTLVARSPGEGMITLEKDTQASAVGSVGSVVGTLVSKTITVR